MYELKPCPRCGAEYPCIIRSHPAQRLFARYRVECWKCRYHTKSRLSVKRAVKAWNRIARGERGYRKIRPTEQLFYIMEYFLRKRWEWVSGAGKNGKDV